MSSEVRALLKQVRRAGAVVESGHRHHKVFVNGSLVGVVPKTPSDHRSIKNTVSDLRRAGVLISKK